jgi:hypothetical protein
MSIPNFGGLQNDLNCYVPDMTHHAHININGETTVNFGTPVADDTELMAALTTAASTSYADLGVEVTEPFGRTLNLTSTDADGTLTLHGRDYLNQQMSEDITFDTGAASSAKAFKYIDRIESATNAGDVVINTGGEFGLPFCAAEVVREITDGTSVESEGTLTAPDEDTPAATTGDVRGTYPPGTTADGSASIILTYVTTSELDGGLYGPVQA